MCEQIAVDSQQSLVFLLQELGLRVLQLKVLACYELSQRGSKLDVFFGAIEAIGKGHDNYRSDMSPESRNCLMLGNGSLNTFPRK
jgi:hypothetical protein